MSTGLIGRSSSTATSSANPELHRIAEDRRRGEYRQCASIRICKILPGNELKKLRFASSHSSSLSIPLFASRIRAQSAVGDGVAAGEMKARGKSLYELLGIPQGGSAAEIKRAYKEMARRYHPDVCPTPDRTEEYTRFFIEVQEAYETLSDPSRRASYDRDLAGGFNLAFSPRRRSYRSNCGQVMEEKSKWRNQWMDQLEGLKRKSMSRHSRMQREQEPFPE